MLAHAEKDDVKDEVHEHQRQHTALSDPKSFPTTSLVVSLIHHIVHIIDLLAYGVRARETVRDRFPPLELVFDWRLYNLCIWNIIKIQWSCV